MGLLVIPLLSQAFDPSGFPVLFYGYNDIHHPKAAPEGDFYLSCGPIMDYNYTLAIQVCKQYYHDCDYLFSYRVDPESEKSKTHIANLIKDIISVPSEILNLNKTLGLNAIERDIKRLPSDLLKEAFGKITSSYQCDKVSGQKRNFEYVEPSTNWNIQQILPTDTSDKNLNHLISDENIIPVIFCGTSNITSSYNGFGDKLGRSDLQLRNEVIEIAKRSCVSSGYHCTFIYAGTGDVLWNLPQYSEGILIHDGWKMPLGFETSYGKLTECARFEYHRLNKSKAKKNKR